MSNVKITLGNISVNFVEQMQFSAHQLGHDITPLLHKYNISIAQLSAHEGRISIPKYMRLGHDLIQQTGIKSFGLNMGRNANFHYYGMLGFAAMAAPTLADMASLLSEFEPLLSHNIRGHSTFNRDKSPALMFYSIAPYNQYNYFVVDSVLASWYQLLQQRIAQLPTAQQDNVIKSVHIEYQRPENAAEYESYFDCPVFFDAQFNGLVLNEAALDLKLTDSCSASFSQAKQLCETQLKRLLQHQDWQTKVAETVSQHLVGKMPDINYVAELLGTSAWTLRRRLYSEETNYQTVLDNTRRDLAISYVRETQLAFSEISFLLGFSSPAAFYKAFKRWVDETPKHYRQRLIALDNVDNSYNVDSSYNVES